MATFLQNCLLFSVSGKPSLEAQSNPIVVNKTSNSIAVTFKHDNAVNEDLKDFYKYFIERKLPSESDNAYVQATVSATHVRNNYQAVAILSDLQYNTRYVLRTVLVRRQNEVSDVCDYAPRGPSTIEVKTACESKIYSCL